VANDIEVKLLNERTDADVAAAASHALEWDALVPADKFEVTVSKRMGHTQESSRMAGPKGGRRTSGAPFGGSQGRQ
jgi:hypothetical protein